MALRSLVTALLVASVPASAGPVTSHPPTRALPSSSNRAPSFGNALFVDPSGDDATGDGSTARPWRTISHAVTKLAPGDTLYIGGGVYFESVTVTRSGTPAAPITIRTAPNELVVIDGAIPEFQTAPATAWQPVGDPRQGEFRSARTYPHLTRTSAPTPGVVGYFMDSMVPLHSYRFAEDLRSANEYWNLPSNSAVAHGVYLGPGVWYDRETQRIHVRLARTSLPGQINYAGETDPRKLALVIAGSERTPLRITGAKHLRLQDLVIRGSAGRTVEVESVDDVQLDGLTIYGGVPALFVKSATRFHLLRSAVRGLAAPWSSRAGMKYRGYGSFLVVADGSRPQNRDWSIAYNEFTDSHDGLILGTIKGLRFHHNLVDNINDDGLLLKERDRALVPEDVQIFENVFSRTLTVLSFAQDRAPGNPVGSGLYVFRNVFDLRRGTYNTPAKSAADRASYAFSRTCGDHGSPTWEPLFVYHNTFLVDGSVYRDYYGAQLVMGTSGTRRRVFNNIFLHVSGKPGLNFPSADDDVQVDGNLMWASGDLAQRDFFASFRSSKLFEASKRVYRPGWGRSDVYADPQLMRVDAELDVRLGPKSPAIDAGVPIPASWPDTLRSADAGKPDIGALPVGAPPLRVGPAASPPP